MAKMIMVQGTMSNSGKSFLTAALCRIFSQDGYRTAPFKSQNMALNSYITEDNLEIGRAQAMQAEAAGITPTVFMNPILLKPTSQMGSQVIVNGEVLGNFSAADYYKEKPKLLMEVKKALDTLASEYDVIVIEGAGSPAEINLREHDIVNMGLARMAGAPVLLVGDIDRGGVFASLYGTVKLLEEQEQAMIKGLVINKFRGDLKILEPGLGMIEDRIGIPVTGVIPMGDIDIDDEDSLAERLERITGTKAIDIAVICLPHISNFTDFSMFERMGGVSLRYVKKINALGNPDLIFLPGTKNTMADLKWLRESGFEALILRQHEKKVPIVGICGGYQMLGEELTDPLGVEYGGSMRGMGLLGAVTVFGQAKTRTQIEGRLINQEIFAAEQQKEISECFVSGYEIHMGKTEPVGNCRAVFRLSDGREDGLSNEDGSVWGTYLHGLFDTEGLADFLVRKLAVVKGVVLDGLPIDGKQYKEEQYDKLADLVRRSLDMEAVYRILEEGV